MTAFVIPDAHGNIALVCKLLQQEGLLDEDFTRLREEVTVIQIGDLINAVSSTIEEDKACLGLAPEWFDVYLVGNHEFPHLSNGRSSFSGFWPDAEIARALHHLKDTGLLQAACVVDDVLITHAGLGPYFRNTVPDTNDVEKIAADLNERWRTRILDPIFTTIGRARGGWQNEGGILWADWSEPKPRKLKQLVGHSVGPHVRIRNAATCIDLGGGKDSFKLAGAWIEDGKIETTIYHALVEEESHHGQ